MATVAMGFAELPLEEVAAEKRKEGLGLRILSLFKHGQRERKAHKGKRDSKKRWKKHLEPVLAWKPRDVERFQERIISQQKRKAS